MNRRSYPSAVSLSAAASCLIAALTPKIVGADDSAAQIMKKVETGLSKAKSYQAQLFISVSRGKDLQSASTGAVKVNVKGIPGGKWSIYATPVPPEGNGSRSLKLPEFQEVFDGATTYIYLPDKNQYGKMTGAPPKTLLGVLRQILHVDEGKLSYTFYSVGSTSSSNTITVNGKPSYAILATPSDPSSRWRNPRIVFGVDKQTKLPNLITAQGELRNPQGAVDVVRVSVGIQNLVLDSKQGLPDSAFQFTPPDGATEKDDLFEKGKPVFDLIQPSAGKG